MRVSIASLVLSLLGLQLTSCSSTPALQARAKHSERIHIPDVPEEVNTSTAFTVKARNPGGKWHNVGLYRPEFVETNVFTGSTARKNSSMAVFDFKGSVEISATYNNGDIEKARIRPNSFGMVPKVSKNTVKFTLDEPKNVILQINDDIFDVLNIFTNTIEENAPSANDPDVIYYGPGYHAISQRLNITSGKTFYVAPGAYISLPGIDFLNATNASIRGHGVLISTARAEVTITHSKHVTIEDIVGINVLPRSLVSDDVVIKNYRGLSNAEWGDGIDVYCSNNVLIDSVFLRNSDDCVAVYNHRDDWYGNGTNITIQNSALWADVAHPINVGTHGNTDSPETTDGLVIRNLDILDHHEKQIDYQGCIAINPGDSNTIQNVLIEDIRVEDFRLGQLLNMRVTYNEKYNTSPGHGIYNVTIRNMTYNGTHAATSVMAGYDENRYIKGVKYENLTVNGLAIYDAMQKPSWYRTTDYVPMYIGPHVYNVTLEK